MMKEDDAAELIAKSADTTLGVIGGDLTDKRCLCLYLFLGVIGHDWTDERGLWAVGGCRMSVWSI